MLRTAPRIVSHPQRENGERTNRMIDTGRTAMVRQVRRVRQPSPIHICADSRIVSLSDPRSR